MLRRLWQRASRSGWLTCSRRFRWRPIWTSWRRRWGLRQRVSSHLRSCRFQSPARHFEHDAAPPGGILGNPSSAPPVGPSGRRPPRAAGWLGLSPRAGGRHAVNWRPHPRRCRRLPGHDRRAPVPGGIVAFRGRPPGRSRHRRGASRSGRCPRRAGRRGPRPPPDAIQLAGRSERS
jgi:hypothetical protein